MANPFHVGNTNPTPSLFKILSKVQKRVNDIPRNLLVHGLLVKGQSHRLLRSPLGRACPPMEGMKGVGAAVADPIY